MFWAITFVKCRSLSIFFGSSPPPFTATVACFAFLNITTGMSIGLWLISLAVGYISYRVCVGLGP
jgi:hypothetical protein